MVWPLIIAGAATATPYVVDALRGDAKAPNVNAPVIDPSQAAGGLANQASIDMANAAAARGLPLRGFDPSVDAAAALQQQGLDAYGRMMSGDTLAQEQYRRNALQAGQMAQGLAAGARGGAYGRAAAMRRGADLASGSMQGAAAGMQQLRAQEYAQGLQGFGALAGQMRGDAANSAAAEAAYLNNQAAMNAQDELFFAGLGNSNFTNAQGIIYNTNVGNADRYANAQSGNATNQLGAEQTRSAQNRQITGAAIGAGAGAAAAFDMSHRPSSHPKRY